MLKKILFPLISLFLAYQTIRMLGIFEQYAEEEMNFWVQLLLAWLLSLFATGVFAITGFAWPTSKVLPAAYYQIHRPATLRKVYDLMGVEYFRKVLLLVFWGRTHRKSYFNGSREGLEAFIFNTHQSEFGHLAAFAAVWVLAAALFYLQHPITAILTILINIIGNLYPVILQRKHRLQVQRLQALANRGK